MDNNDVRPEGRGSEHGESNAEFYLYMEDKDSDWLKSIAVAYTNDLFSLEKIRSELNLLSMSNCRIYYMGAGRINKDAKGHNRHLGRLEENAENCEEKGPKLKNFRRN